MDNLKMHEQLATLRAQRDELLVALERIGKGPHENEEFSGPRFAQIARAAIAKVRG